MTLAILATSLIAGYSLLCWIRPFGRCSHCKGVGVQQTFITRRYRPCRWCRGAGLRLRIGRRAYNHLAAIQRDGASR